MILEKVYDELYGMIEDLKKKIQAGGGSEVTITPALESGVKIADYAIGSDEGSLFAPSNMHSYSTTEHIIGKWIDGTTDVYECTFYLASASTEDAQVGDLSELNVGTVIEGNGVFTNQAGVICPISYSHYTDEYDVTFLITSTKESLELRSGTGNRNLTDIYITLRYTKAPAEAKKTTKKK